MYKILIVDDETAIRKGLAGSVPWRRLGFEVVGLCENGTAALALAESVRPDVVLTDIRMPEMDGMQLMEMLNERLPTVKVVILSGFSDFEYLKKSIVNRAVDYLLKPTDMDEFVAVFERIKGELDLDRKSVDELVCMREENRAAQNQRYAKWLEEFVRGYISSDESEKQCELREKKGLYLDNCYVMSLLPDQLPGEEPGKLHRLLEEIAEAGNRNIGPHSCLFVTHEETVVCLCSSSPEEELDEGAAEAFAERLISGILRERQTPVSVGISDLCTEISMLPICYEQANCSVRQRVFSPSVKLFHYSQVEAAAERRVDYLDIAGLEPHLLMGDFEAVRSALDGLFRQFENKTVKEYELADYAAMEAMLSLSRWAIGYDVDTEAVLNSLGMKYSDIFRCNTLQMKKDFVSVFYYAMLGELAQGRGRKAGSSVAGMVRKCIDEEYGNNAISLEYVAGRVGRNPVYISKVFKHELGCNFSEYLVKTRIRKAEELLKNPMLRIYEIAQMVGYVNPSNFIKVFRKYKGLSPNEFREVL